MSNFFPSLNVVSEAYKQNKELPLLKEYAWDFERDEFLFDENGKFIIVEGLEALKVRNYLSLKIYRDRWFIHNGKVGSRLKQLIGASYNTACLHLQEILEEALVDGVYVTSIENLETSLEGNKMKASFTVNSIYGNYTETINQWEVAI